MEDGTPDSFVHTSCLQLVPGSAACPVQLPMAGSSVAALGWAVSGVGLAPNRCTAYHRSVEAENLYPRALGVRNCGCKKCYVYAGIFTE